MPSSVADVFAAAGLTPAGPVQWGQRLPEAGPGVYAVSLTAPADARDGIRAECPLSAAAIEELLAVRPELRVDGARPTADELAARLASLWLPDERIVYIGLAGTSLRNRVAQVLQDPARLSAPTRRWLAAQDAFGPS